MEGDFFLEGVFSFWRVFFFFGERFFFGRRGCFFLEGFFLRCFLFFLRVFFSWRFFFFGVVRDQVYNTCCCEFLVRSAFLSLVWHMHDVCLLHGHVAHSSHYG